MSQIHLTTILNLQNKVKNVKHHFVACSGWTALFCEGHLSWSIPDRVLEEDIALLPEGKKLPGSDEPLKCSWIVPAHVGGRVKYCCKFRVMYIAYYGADYSSSDCPHTGLTWEERLPCHQNYLHSP